MPSLGVTVGVLPVASTVGNAGGKKSGGGAGGRSSGSGSVVPTGWACSMRCALNCCCSRSLRHCSRYLPRYCLICLKIVCSSKSNSVLHSLAYTIRAISSGINAMDLTTSVMAAVRLMGSPWASLSTMLDLKLMKSASFAAIYSSTSVWLWARTKVSGSSSGGNGNTLMLMPSLSSMSTPRMAALMPASSPSNISVTLLVNRRMAWMCPSVKAVPDDAMTFLNPA